MFSMIIPRAKDAKGDLSDCDNYRPIAITTIISKIFEHVILARCMDKLQTSENQFGFKKGHSTDQSIFLMKQVIDYYLNNSSPVYLCFMDLSKAFDRVHHDLLWTCLEKRNINTLFIRILKFWYSMQKLTIQWNNVQSKPFAVSNGTRQGSVLSPYLFNVFIDELSYDLRATGIGCFVDNVCFNHIFYADDSVLMAPSPDALQKLIDVSRTFGAKQRLTYNAKKTKCMIINPRHRKPTNNPIFSLNDQPINRVQQEQYLGYIVREDMSDTDTIKHEIRKQYIRGNMIKRKFGSCSEEVKLRLFRSYCSSFYCSHLWSEHNTEYIHKAKVCHNNILRYFISSHYLDSISQHFVCRNLDNFDVLRRKSMYNFYTRLLCSKNLLVSTILSSNFFIYSNFMELFMRITHL